MVRGAIFDLDGVITDTAEYHYLAWKRLAAQLGLDFSIEQNKTLKEVSQLRSLELLLEAGSKIVKDSENEQLAELKNTWYVEYVSKMDPSELLPGMLELLIDLKNRGIKLALCSVSKKARQILECLEIIDYFDVIVDGAMVTQAKPGPEKFLLAADKLGLLPWDCIVFEDAAAGIEAAQRAGMKVIGVANSNIMNIVSSFIKGLHECQPDQFFIDQRWCLSENNFEVDLNKYYEGAFTLGSGYLSVRGSLEEGLSDDPQDEEYLRVPANVTLEKTRPCKSKWGTFVPGIVGYHFVLNDEMINLPWFLEFQIFCDGEKLDLEKSKVTHYHRYLYMKDATLTRSLLWKTQSGMEVAIEFFRYINLYIPALSVQRVRIYSMKGNGNIEIISGINARVRTNGYNHFKTVDVGVTDDGNIYSDVMTDKGNRIFETSKLLSFPAIPLKTIAVDGHIYYQGNCRLEANQMMEFIKLTSITTNRDLEKGKYRERALKILSLGIDSDFNQLYQEHTRIWHQKWEQSDVVIEGDDDAQLALRFSIFHMIRSNAEHDPRVAICAKGHAGEAYYGRYFWDNDIFILPFFLYTNWEAAKNLILFRYNTLSGAKENARRYGYKGARYAWESSIDGKEESAGWQYADHEIHITADVIYALWHYYCQTDDWEFMKQYGIEMLVETARYWVERVDVNPVNQSINLLGVMGPDEYLPFTKNNAYTNWMVKFSLAKTLQMLEHFESKNPKEFCRKMAVLNLKPFEIEQFRQVMVGLTIPIDHSRNLVMQSEDFGNYADIDFDQIWMDRSRPFGHFISQEKNYRSKALKQADVLMLMYLLPGDFTNEQMKRAYEYYEPLTTHDSSLSATIYAIVATWLGKRTEAETYFQKALKIDLDLGKKGCEEGIHIANAGGLWQSVIHGFAGIPNVIQSDILTINPRLPKNWQRIRFHLKWKGKVVGIEISKEHIVIINQSQEPIKVIVKDRLILVKASETKTVGYTMNI
ncbi:MAG TPA: beta-phosphoglucomutase [Firmicutes bacterium]|nr:beta-phosphoglucomutase [Bacillota bacterium]